MLPRIRNAGTRAYRQANATCGKYRRLVPRSCGTHVPAAASALLVRVGNADPEAKAFVLQADVERQSRAIARTVTEGLDTELGMRQPPTMREMRPPDRCVMLFMNSLQSIDKCAEVPTQIRKDLTRRSSYQIARRNTTTTLACKVKRFLLTSTELAASRTCLPPCCAP